MIIRYVIGTLLIVIPVGLGIYVFLKEFTAKELLEMFIGLIAVAAVIGGIYLLVA
jgi:ABC-type phosphate transport system permease subunit